MQPGFSLIITPDGLKAYLQIPPNVLNFPSKNELGLYLKRHGVVAGVNDKKLEAIADGKVKEGLTEVACGIPPQTGIPGKIELLIDISNVGKPKAMQDGRVNYRELGTVINVTKGEKLARRVPPTEGIEGWNVFGKQIAAPLMDDVVLYKGSGTRFSEEDSNLLLSEISGAFSICSEGRMEVKNEKVIENDIDFSTGNIKFAGNLLVKGSIRAGFFVEVNGDLSVLGNVEDSQIKVNGNIKIDGGAVGCGTGMIECNGKLNVRHVENFSMKSGESVIICEDAIHSMIMANGRIKAKSIIGGTISGFGVECESVGCEAETKTIIDIGRLHDLIEERKILQKRKTECFEKLTNLKTMIFEFVRDSMDLNGQLSDENEKTLESYKKKAVESMQVCQEIKKRIDEIEKVEQSFGTQLCISAKCIYPNTLIKFGNDERLIMELKTNVKLSSGNSLL